MAGFQVTDRDAGVFFDLGEYGFLDTKMVHSLRFPNVTEHRCRQRLRRYKEHGLVFIVPAAISYSSKNRAEKVPQILALTERGARIVEDWFDVTPKRVLRSRPQPETIMHRLATTRLRINFDAAFRRCKLPVPEWIMEQDSRNDLPENVPPNQRSMLFHRFEQDGRIYSCRPDAACRFALPVGQNGESKSLVFYWEVDRSTEGHKQIRCQKIAGHRELISNRSWVRYWPDLVEAPARIVYVCRSAQRCDELAETYRATGVADYVRFGNRSDVTARKALRESIWLDCDGEYRRIWNG